MSSYPPPRRHRDDNHFHGHTTQPPRSSLSLTASTSDHRDPVLEELGAERRANLFQFLLRDLQVEGVPLLAVEVDHPSNFQAALWTTLAELADQVDPQKACLVLEDMPVPNLQAFVACYEQMRIDESLVAQLPELRRVKLSILGKGVGPAIVVETLPPSKLAENEEGEREPLSPLSPLSSSHEHRVVAASKMFVDRVLRGLNTHPSLGRPGHVTWYRTCAFLDAFHALSTAWTAVCELEAVPDTDASAMVLWPLVEAPTGEDDKDDEAIASRRRRFNALTDVLNRSLRLYGTDRFLDVTYFSPMYDCVASLGPDDSSPLGHPRMPSSSATGVDAKLSNYLRRSPVPACLLQLKGGEEEEEIARSLEDDNGAAQELIRIGREALESALKAERDIVWGS